MAADETIKVHFNTVGYDRDGPVALIALNRPEKLNAINAQMVTELGAVLAQAESDDSIKAIVVYGNGRAFSAGFDLETNWEPGNASSIRRELKKDFELIMRFWDSPKPTVAAVHKYCFGSAMELAVACDVTVSSDDCRFGAPEVRFGSGIVCLILPWLIGGKQAKELLLTGDDRVSADRALALGLVNHVVAEGQQLDAAVKIARRMALNDEHAVRLTKRAINRSFEIMGFRQALREALQTDVEIEMADTPESREFNRILSEKGVKAAVLWREERILGQTDRETGKTA